MTLFQAFGQFAAAGAVTEPTSGWVLIEPSSIDSTGGTATITSGGSVTLSGVTQLSLNGVFSSDYETCAIVWSLRNDTGNSGLAMRLRVAGVDASGNDYAFQTMNAASTSVAATRTTSTNIMRVGLTTGPNNESGAMAFVTRASAAVPTIVRTTTAYTAGGANVFDYGNVHSVSTAYDGFTIIPDSGYALTGRIAVYGMR